MIPIFVSSLPDCQSRRSRISAILDRLKLSFEFVDGVDGRNGLPPEYEHQIDRVATRKAGRRLSDAEFACALSHIAIYRRIVTENIDYALMLADDHKPLPALVRYLQDKHYQDAELTQLRYAEAYVRKGEVKPLFDTYQSYLRAPKMNITGSCGCVVSSVAAQHFIDHAVPITKEADWPDCIETLVRCRQRREDRQFLDAFHRRKIRKTYGSLPRDGGG